MRTPGAATLTRAGAWLHRKSDSEVTEDESHASRGAGEAGEDIFDEQLKDLDTQTRASVYMRAEAENLQELNKAVAKIGTEENIRVDQLDFMNDVLRT